MRKTVVYATPSAAPVHRASRRKRAGVTVVTLSDDSSQDTVPDHRVLLFKIKIPLFQL